MYAHVSLSHGERGLSLVPVDSVQLVDGKAGRAWSCKGFRQISSTNKTCFRGTEKIANTAGSSVGQGWLLLSLCSDPIAEARHDRLATATGLYVAIVGGGR